MLKLYRKSLNKDETDKVCIKRAFLWCGSCLRAVCPRLSLALRVGFLQQTDNRAPAGLPVHLTGHDSSHAALFITSLAHALFIFDFIFVCTSYPPDTLPTTLIVQQAVYSMCLQEESTLSYTRFSYVVISLCVWPFGGPDFQWRL